MFTSSESQSPPVSASLEVARLETPWFLLCRGTFGVRNCLRSNIRIFKGNVCLESQVIVFSAVLPRPAAHTCLSRRGSFRPERSSSPQLPGPRPSRPSLILVLPERCLGSRFLLVSY